MTSEDQQDKTEYKAVIRNWSKGYGNVINGNFEGHPNFSGFGHTSPVIRCTKLDSGDHKILTKSGNTYLLKVPQ